MNGQSSNTLEFRRDGPRLPLFEAICRESEKLGMPGLPIFTREIAADLDRERGNDPDEFDEYGHHRRECWNAEGGYWFRCIGPDTWIAVSAEGVPPASDNPGRGT